MKETVIRWQWIIQHGNNLPKITHAFYSEQEAREKLNNIVGKAEWTRTEFAK